MPIYEYRCAHCGRIFEALRDLGASVGPSHTNFLLVRSRVPDVAARLRDRVLLVSDVSDQLPSGFIRVSVGTCKENDAFLAAFERVERGHVFQGTDVVAPNVALHRDR